MRSVTRGSKFGALALVLVMLGALSGCGESTNVEVSDRMVTDESASFEVIEEDGTSYAVGHGIVFETMPDWVPAGDEVEGNDGTTWDWAIGQPAETQPLPGEIQMSMGMPGTGAQVRSGLLESSEAIAELSDGYELLDKGDVDIPGAEEAKFLHFRRDLQYQGATHRLEQVSLFIQLTDETTSTLRFIAPDGEWDSLMKPAYDSVQVTVGQSA